MGNRPSTTAAKTIANAATKSVPRYPPRTLTGENVNISSFEERDSILDKEERRNLQQQDTREFTHSDNTTSNPHHHHIHDHNPFVDPRVSHLDPAFSLDPAHRRNVTRILEAEEERISEQEKEDDEKNTHRFANQLVQMQSIEIEPMYENTVGSPNSPLAMHHSPKSEIMQRQQGKHKYDDLEGMYKIVDIMNFMRDLREARLHTLRREKEAAKGVYRGKFYGKATKGEESVDVQEDGTEDKKPQRTPVKHYTQEEMMKGFAQMHNIPLSDVQTIVDHFQFPNHISMQEKQYAFWHDFDLESMWSTTPMSSKQTDTHPDESEISASSKKPGRSAQEIEDDVLKELQELEYQRRRREQQDSL